jgi:hypothetical protein
MLLMKKALLQTWRGQATTPQRPELLVTSSAFDVIASVLDILA